MDPHEALDRGEERVVGDDTKDNYKNSRSEVGRGARVLKILFRCCFSIWFSLVASFLFSCLFGLLAIGIGSLFESRPVLLSARCRIISSSVDIRSSKVCELGLLNYKAKRVLYPPEKSSFRCRHDYYWASIFEVEYREYFSGQLLSSVAEAPKEALPHDCRPGFNAAWLAKFKYKVNETYNCKYSPGSWKADLNLDGLFNCQSKDPSLVERVRRSFIPLMRSSFYLENDYLERDILYIVAGAVAGMLTATFFAVLVKVIRISVSVVARQLISQRVHVFVFAAHLRKVFLLLAYLLTMTWLALKYGNMIGLKQLLLDYSFWGRVITR